MDLVPEVLQNLAADGVDRNNETFDAAVADGDYCTGDVRDGYYDDDCCTLLS